MGFITRRSSSRKIAQARAVAAERKRIARAALMHKPPLSHPQPASREAIEAARERVRAVDPDQVAVDYPGAFQGWQNGSLRPWQLTIAFNRHGFFGDWVDIAVGVTEPEVEAWEKGIIYPTWDQLTRVAALTDTNPDELLSTPDTLFTPHFARCTRAFWAEDLRRSYSPAIVLPTVSAHPHTPTDEAVVHGYQTAMLELAEPILEHLRDEADSDESDLELLARIL